MYFWIFLSLYLYMTFASSNESLVQTNSLSSNQCRVEYPSRPFNHTYVWHCAQIGYNHKILGCVANTLISKNSNASATWTGSCGLTTYTFALHEWSTPNSSCNEFQNVNYELFLDGHLADARKGCWDKDFRGDAVEIGTGVNCNCDRNGCETCGMWLSYDSLSSAYQLHTSLFWLLFTICSFCYYFLA